MNRLLLTMCFVLVGLTPLGVSAADRVALVIGNAKYKAITPLKNTTNDAKAIDSSLRSLGYQTQLVLDASEATLKREVRAFSARASEADVAIVFYAGHGAQINGKNYLLPVDMEPPQREVDVSLQSMEVDAVLSSINARVKVLILDACRDNPALSRSSSKFRGSISRGLAPPQSIESSQGGGVFIAFATEAGNVAADGDGSNSPFTQALLKHIKTPVSVDDMFSMVTRDVRAATRNAQIPYKYASLDGVVCLTPSCSRPQQGGSSVSESVTKPNSVAQDPRSSSLSEALASNSAFEVAEKSAGLSGVDLRHVLDRVWMLSQGDHPPFTPFDQSADKPEFFRFLISSRKVLENGRISIAINAHEKKKALLVFSRKEKVTTWTVLDCQNSTAGVHMHQKLDSSDYPLETIVLANPLNMSLTPIPPGSVFQHLESFLCDPIGLSSIKREVSDSPSFWEFVNRPQPGIRLYIGTAYRSYGDYRVAYMSTQSDSPIEHNDFGFSYSVQLGRYLFNCHSRTARLDTESLDEKGNIVSKTNGYGPNAFVPISPGSPLEILFGRACS